MSSSSLERLLVSARLPHDEELPILWAQFTTGDNVPALNSHSVLALLRHIMNNINVTVQRVLNFLN